MQQNLSFLSYYYFVKLDCEKIVFVLAKEIFTNLSF